MSIDLGVGGRGITYLNFRQTYDADVERTCRAVQEFNYSNFVDDSSDYLLALERLRVPIHRVPMVPALIPAITFVPIAGAPPYVINTDQAFSLRQWLDDLNAKGLASPNDLFFKIDASGRLQILFNGFNDYTITFDQTFADIMDIDANINAASQNVTPRQGQANEWIITGSSSLFDRFDQLYKVQIEASGLNVAREIITTDATLPIITDILIPTDYATSYTEAADPKTVGGGINVTYPTRQAVLYGGENERRYINLVGKLAIQNITIQAVAIFRDGTRNQILIPRRGVFECKLGFYRK